MHNSGDIIRNKIKLGFLFSQFPRCSGLEPRKGENTRVNIQVVVSKVLPSGTYHSP